jgi:murein DD-endopeptidase MepM/ murein hydrolase activator NlpD
MGKTEPCYTDDQQHLYAFLGLSALMEPGSYDVTLHLHADGLDVDTSFPLEVEAGRYGFQFIDPPPSLNKLLDASLMSRESEYLAFWRLVRSPERRWQFPLDFPLPRPASVSAGYGDRRSYGGMVDGYHSGVDYRIWSGVPVLAPADGVVILTDTLEMRGNVVLINHGWGVVTGYWHLSKIDVNIGDEVKCGEPFAYVGNTGLSTGSHLHWEMWVNGVSVDAEQWLEPDGLAAELPPFEAPAVYTTSEPEPPSESQTR